MPIIRSGRWALSRLIEVTPGSFVPAAMQQAMAAGIACEAHYAPLNTARTGFALDVALVRFPNGISGTVFDANVRLIPNVPIDLTLGDLSQAQRTQLRDELEAWLIGYSFTDWDGPKVVAAFSAAGFTLATPVREVLRAIYVHLFHSDSRPKTGTPELHNTEYLDDFSTDPTSRWTHRLQTFAWDSGDGTVDVAHAGQPTLSEYTANTPGSLAQEAQVSTVSFGGENRIVGVACRIGRGDGTNDDFYAFDADRASGNVQFQRRVGGVLSALASNTQSFTAGNFVAFRIAAVGDVGDNVALSGWYLDHGSSTKPSDPGWDEVSAAGWTYDDTSADRLDDAVHDACGIGGGVAVNTDYDTRHCWWKSRAIADRVTFQGYPHANLLTRAMRPAPFAPGIGR